MSTKIKYIKALAAIETAVVDMIQSATFGIASSVFITKNVHGDRLSAVAKVAIAKAAVVAYREAGLHNAENFERVFTIAAARAMKANLNNEADVQALHMAAGLLRHGVLEITNKYGRVNFELEVIASFN